MTTMYLIRHAEAEGNLYRRIHGQYNSLITDNGYRQISALRARFREIPIDAIYSSDLFRTIHTARAIYEPKGLTLHTRPDLREIHMGAWEDRAWASVDQEDHREMTLFSTSSPAFRAPGGGESYTELRDRGAAALLDIAAHHPNQTVAVVAHGTFIRNTMACLQGYALEDTNKYMGHSDNTAVTKLEIENGIVRVLSENDNSHLTQEISTLARQHWWNKDATKKDINLWFRPFSFLTPEDGTFYLQGREEIWEKLYGNLTQCNALGFLKNAKKVWKAHPRSLMMAMAGNRPVGILQMDPYESTHSRTGYISFLYVVPEERRSGLGIQILGKAVSLSRPQGYDRLRLACSERNGPALSFYEKFGFYENGYTLGAHNKLYQLEKSIGYERRDIL